MIHEEFLCLYPLINFLLEEAEIKEKTRKIIIPYYSFLMTWLTSIVYLRHSTSIIIPLVLLKKKTHQLPMNQNSSRLK